MTLEKRSELTKVTLERLEHCKETKAKLGNVTCMHAMVAYAEEPEAYTRAIINLFHVFFDAIETDARGILKASEDSAISFKDLCRVTLVNFYTAQFEHTVKDAVDAI
mmetsp:Transcript_1672/g.1465  ORF Transcript_1672/g.1465 Transcript_1672/m.1465 type:complete len:107 (+) Transcript_1672:62-382(+)